MKKISLVICVFNEEDNIQPLVEQITGSLDSVFDYDVIYVDDGSTDSTVQKIKSLNHPRITLIELKKNYGQSSALAAGIDHAEGEYIITMDGDLQNDPTDIPMMVELAEKEEWDLVAGSRKNRKDGFILRKIPSKLANAMIRRTTNVRIKDYGCTLKAIRKDVAKNLGIYGELHRFIPVLASFDGARITQVDVKHHSRMHGKSKYGLGRTFRVMSDLLLMLFLKKYLQRPMHLFGNTGILVFLIGAAISLYLLVLKILGQDIWGKPLMLLGILLVITGIQLITIGIVTELQMRTYYESQSKKPYQIKRITGGQKDKAE
ncbi:MAG: glycosyltransferase family 2 protein [Bacteroidales bacterium]|nr:glycosyltransferase family 2 protein [Bacteroidales bacterium]